jgi:ribose/xylose/arabinose/galactoside ABC-type transport system permease subunit
MRAGSRPGTHTPKSAILSNNGAATMRKRLNSSSLGLVAFYAVIVLLFMVLSPAFRTGDNLFNLLSGFSHVGILAVGVMFPILLGGIDLSVGAIVGLVGMVMLDLIMIVGLPSWVAVLIGLAVGTLAGFTNGLLVSRLKLPPFIATLATMVAYRGLTYGISGRAIFPELASRGITDRAFRNIDGSVGLVPHAFIYLVLIVIVTHLLLRYTRLGVNLYAVGGNEKAARLAGIPVDWVKIIAYTIPGVCCAITALILTSRMSTSTEDLGMGAEMSAIAAAVIGGVSLQGGVGQSYGPALGAFLIGTIYIGATLLGVTTYAQPVLAGVILLGAIGYGRYTRQRRDQEWLKGQQIQLQEAAK